MERLLGSQPSVAVDHLSLAEQESLNKKLDLLLHLHLYLLKAVDVGGGLVEAAVSSQEDVEVTDVEDHVEQSEDKKIIQPAELDKLHSQQFSGDWCSVQMFSRNKTMELRPIIQSYFFLSFISSVYL